MVKGRQLKVLFITSWYPTPEWPVGGVFIREHARAVSLYDNVATLHLAGYDSSLHRLYEIQPVHEEDLPTWRVRYRRLLPKTSYLVYLWSTVAAYLHIRRQGFSPHIIHAHISNSAFPAVFIGKCLGKPVVVTEHFSDIEGRIFSTGLWDELSKFALKKANLVIVDSEDVKRRFRYYGVDAHSIVTPTVDISRFSSTNRTFSKTSKKDKIEKKRILFVGSLEPRKGIGYLLEAIKIISSQRHDFLLDIIGSGPMKNSYEETVKTMGLADVVSFYGYQSDSELVRFMELCDFFVLPSVQENFGVVLIEAMACGKPVIATRCGGPEDFVTDEVGILIPPKDVEALAKALMQMLDHFEAFNSSAIARYAQERFSHKTVGALLHSIYEGLIPHEVGYSGNRIQINPSWRVIDIGSGHNPHLQADVWLDRFVGPTPHRSGRSAIRDDRPFVIADTESLPFRNNAFDYAIASHVAEHLEDPVRFCSELMRIAKGGYIETPGKFGELLVAEPFHKWYVSKRRNKLLFERKRKNNPLGFFSPLFYALFYAGEECNRPTLKIKLWGIHSLVLWLRRIWTSRWLRRYTYTCFEFNGPFDVEVIE